MQSQNFFDDMVSKQALQQRLKMKFLENQKQRLQIALSQLLTNLQLLRHTNQSIIKQQQSTKINFYINQSNKHLEKSYQRILLENQNLSTQLFLQKQISIQQQMQYNQNIKNYEEKILELRRSIQMKQGFVQNLQTNVKYHRDANNYTIPPHSLSMIFYQEVEDYKSNITKLAKDNRQLTHINQKINKENQSIKAKIQLLQCLIQSSISFSEVRDWYRQKQRSHSEPKNHINFRLEKLYKNSIDQEPIQKMQINNRISQILSILLKKNIQNDQLLKIIKQVRNKLEKTQKLLKKTQQWNIQYQKSRKDIIQQLNYYKKSTQQLLKLLMKKKSISRVRSLEKSSIQQIIRNVKMPREITYVSDRKQLWVNFKNKLQKTALLVPQLYNGKRRSNSCVRDYTQLQIDDVDKYLAKQRIKKQQIVDNLSNFSIMLEEYTSNKDKDPFQFSAIKPSNERMSYSELKDLRKNKQNMKKQGLTLIEEDIFDT